MRNLDSLWRQGKSFPGVTCPIVAGAMTWISDTLLVSSVSSEGPFGC